MLTGHFTEVYYSLLNYSIRPITLFSVSLCDEISDVSELNYLLFKKPYVIKYCNGPVSTRLFYFCNVVN